MQDTRSKENMERGPQDIGEQLTMAGLAEYENKSNE